MKMGEHLGLKPVAVPLGNAIAYKLHTLNG